jgi:hypothetical protein
MLIAVALELMGIVPRRFPKGVDVNNVDFRSIPKDFEVPSLKGD